MDNVNAGNVKRSAETPTPGPWSIWYETTGKCHIEQRHSECESEIIAITQPGHEADAEHIVRCVNAHEELVKAIEQIREAFYVGGTRNKLMAAIEPTKALLAKVKS